MLRPWPYPVSPLVPERPGPQQVEEILARLGDSVAQQEDSAYR